MEGGEGQGWAEVVEWAVRAYGGYVREFESCSPLPSCSSFVRDAHLHFFVLSRVLAWIDITLTVTPHSLYLLNRLLQHSHIPFRLLALDALSKIVVKGMKDPSEKIQLLAILSVVPVLSPLEEQTRLLRAESGSDEEVEIFRERMAKLLNAYGIELGKIVAADALAEEKTKVEAEAMLEASLPLFLRFLGDEFDDTSSAVFGFLDDVLKRVSLLPPPLFSTFVDLDTQRRCADIFLVLVRAPTEQEGEEDGRSRSLGNQARLLHFATRGRHQEDGVGSGC